MEPSNLLKINSVEEAPPDTYIFYSLKGGIFCLPREHYTAFVHRWSNLRTGRAYITMDLAAAQQHSLVLDIDATCLADAPRDIPEELYNLIHSNLNLLLLPHVSHFTYIIATRLNGLGVHVHLPEFTIAHDDYIELCEELKPKFANSFAMKRYSLDILTNAMLSGSCKPDTSPYKATRLMYSDERTHHIVHLNRDDLKQQMDAMRKNFRRRKDNNESVFRKLLVFNSTSELLTYLKQLTMPVAKPFDPIYKLSYPTSIHDVQSVNSTAFKDVAILTYKRNPEKTAFIVKGKQLLFSGQDFMKMCQYMKLNAFTMATFQTNNFALKRWYQWHRNQQHLEATCPPEFQILNQALKEESIAFEKDTNPIKSILQFNKGYYFLPVFYVLCKQVSKTCNITIKESIGHVAKLLEDMLDPEFQDLLRRTSRVHENHVKSIVHDLTEHTLYFCGNHLNDRPSTMKQKLSQIVRDAQRSILNLTSHDQIFELLRKLQHYHFPISLLCLWNSLKKPNRQCWNFLTESWHEINDNSEVHNHMTNLWVAIKRYLREIQSVGTVGGPDDALLDKFNLNPVVSSIHSDSTMERKSIQMDKHNWLIRLPNGTLDLLTGHVGGMVPEFYLSDRKLGIKISRDQLLKLLDAKFPLRRLYHLLIDKHFFLRYLKCLFLDKTPHVLETLQWMVGKELPDLPVDEYYTSILHFYAHLCKYMSFEYDMVMYLMDVLASAFIATNYERKFFVLKGVTSNGKSKLFELLSKVFGGYLHNIQSDNLKPGSGAANATPELASTLFSCRIVTFEELDGKLNENRVKQITGNSNTTFRNLFEASVGGIPTAKIFSTTNKLPECQATKAFQERVVALPFHATFSNRAPTTTSEQVRQNVYPKETYVTEQSYEGCFLTLYYHLDANIDMKDGYLHYRKAPDAIKEYTEEYLINTDVYVQFKLYMDIQLLPEASTTMNELRSAIRQFLKAMKNLSTHESELIVKFDEEFSAYRQSDLNLGSCGYVSPMDEMPETSAEIENQSLLEDDDSQTVTNESDCEPPSAKRAKTIRETASQSVVFYYGVVIKNMKRTEN